jgi:hypothetical protein
MGLHSGERYITRMSGITARFLLLRGASLRPFDPVGIACLAWAGAFLCVTAVAATLVR